MNLIRKPRVSGLTLTEHRLDNKEVLPLLHFDRLSETGIVKHCFTTRAGGVSEGVCSSLNLSFTRGDDEEAVLENYRRLAQVLEVDMSRFVCTDQTHTTNVRVVTETDAGKGVVCPKDYTDVDGLVTNVPGLVLSTFFADCVPLYFVDPVHGAIGMSHSGWRGTVGRMGARTLEVMAREYGTDPAEVICAIGPSICQECYEVSADVAEAFRAEFPGYENEILETKPGEKYQLDLWRANEIVLTDAGVLPEHLTTTNVCTCCNPAELFSHRASQGRRGNLGGFLSLI